MLVRRGYLPPFDEKTETSAWKLQKGRRSRRLRAWTFVILAFGAIAFWKFLRFRRVWVEQSNISCEPQPWYKLAWNEQYFTPKEATSKYAVPRSARSKMGHVQVCSKLNRNSRYLQFLIDSHRTYAAQHGYEYELFNSGDNAASVWDKVESLLAKVRAELEKPLEERLSWIFYSDIDTVIFNPMVDLEVFLPPDDGEDNNAWFLISEDGRGMNAGAFFLRIDARSRAFLEAVLHYPVRDLEFYEQSVMRIIAERRQLQEMGEMVVVKPRLFNSYAHEQAFSEELPVFLLHYPSEKAKRGKLIPLIDKLASGKLAMTGEVLERLRDQVVDVMASFWLQRE